MKPTKLFSCLIKNNFKQVLIRNHLTIVTVQLPPTSIRSPINDHNDFQLLVLLDDPPIQVEELRELAVAVHGEVYGLVLPRSLWNFKKHLMNQSHKCDFLPRAANHEIVIGREYFPHQYTLKKIRRVLILAKVVLPVEKTQCRLFLAFLQLYV